MQEFADRVDNLEAVVWRGNGHPGLVTRMEVVENRQDSLDKSQEQWEAIASKLAISVVLSLLGIVGRLAWETMIVPHLH